MIEYNSGKYGLWFACSLKGSVFPKAFLLAVPCAVISVAGHWILDELDFKQDVRASDKGTTVLSSFSFILGFVLVFRTQQAYSRWWEGGTLLQELRGEWFNAYSCLLAWANPAADRKADVDKFQHQLARLMSMLYAAGLAQVTSLQVKMFEVIDLEDFDDDALNFLDGAHDACEVTLQWIQRLIVDANGKETIKVAPPILSRVYNQLGNGMVKLNNARKITRFPFPFPLSQMVTVMLLIYWVATVVVCATSIESPVWAGLLSFTVTLSFWSINFIALELEDPFGGDPNDLPIHDMQADLNCSFMELLKPVAMKAPGFDYHNAYHAQVPTRMLDFNTTNTKIYDQVSAFRIARGKDCFDRAEEELKRSKSNQASVEPTMMIVAPTNGQLGPLGSESKVAPFEPAVMLPVPSQASGPKVQSVPPAGINPPGGTQGAGPPGGASQISPGSNGRVSPDAQSSPMQAGVVNTPGMVSPTAEPLAPSGAQPSGTPQQQASGTPAAPADAPPLRAAA